jgi:uncharacterized membrane protein YoaK (UPF0700 family)
MIKMLILRNERKMSLSNSTSESMELGIFLAIVGGFLDAYTFVGRGGVFANAQTGNFVLMGIEVAMGEWKQAVLHAVPILAFIFGVIVAEIIKKPSMRLLITDNERAVLILETIVLFIIGFLPSTIPNIIATIAISFVAAVQFSVFRKLVGSPYSTIAITGNLRSATQEAYIAVTRKDYKSAFQAVRFSMVNLSFLVGAILGGGLTSFIGVKAVWITVVLLICSVILLGVDERKNNEEGSKMKKDSKKSLS